MADRPLVDLLRLRFGESAVSVCKPSGKRPESDALIIAGDVPPRGIGSMTSLLRAGSTQLVIISLEAFAKIAGDGIRVRRIEQPDDPLGARIFCSNYMTRGFALNDVLPYASTGTDARVSWQRQLRRGAAVQQLEKSHGFEIVLTSVTDSDSSSGHPICLYKPIDGGGVVVLDVDPIDAEPTNRDEPNLAAFILQNVLGLDQTSLGCYTVPVHDERRLHDLLELLADRYPAVRLAGSTPRDAVVEIGAAMRTFGLVEDTRPVLLIRTMLAGDDVSGFYGTWYYLRQLIRAEPYASPYAVDLLRKFRLIWKPVNAPWCPNGVAMMGDRESCAALSVDPSELAAIIDVTEGSARRCRITYDRNPSAAAQHAATQKMLTKSLGGSGFASLRGSDGVDMSRRDDLRWRLDSSVPKVVVNAKAFDEPIHRSAAQAGARLFQIEVPAQRAAFAANSIARTDGVAIMLETLIGLQYGLIAVNRRCDTLKLPGFGALVSGRAVCTLDNGKLRPATKRVG